MIFAILWVLLPALALAQNGAELTRKERKELKARAKQFKKNPTSLKTLLDKEARLTQTVDSLEYELSKTQAELSTEKRKVNTIREEKAAQTESLASELEEALTQLIIYQNFEAECPEKMIAGTVYRVQIGAYGKRDLSAQQGANVNFEVETEDGLQKYTVGQFTDKEEAKALREELKSIGLTDAWVVTYLDGKRLNTARASN